MTEGCLHCHNTHKDNTKHDWKAGDVRGVLEIVRPLDRDEERIHRGLRGTITLVAAVGAGLLGLSTLTLFMGNRRRRTAAVALGGGSSGTENVAAAAPDENAFAPTIVPGNGDRSGTSPLHGSTPNGLLTPTQFIPSPPAASPGTESAENDPSPPAEPLLRSDVSMPRAPTRRGARFDVDSGGSEDVLFGTKSRPVHGR